MLLFFLTIEVLGGLGFLGLTLWAASRHAVCVVMGYFIAVWAYKSGSGWLLAGVSGCFGGGAAFALMTLLAVTCPYGIIRAPIAAAAMFCSGYCGWIVGGWLSAPMFGVTNEIWLHVVQYGAAGVMALIGVFAIPMFPWDVAGFVWWGRVPWLPEGYGDLFAPEPKPKHGVVHAYAAAPVQKMVHLRGGPKWYIDGTSLKPPKRPDIQDAEFEEVDAVAQLAPPAKMLGNGNI